MLMHEKTYVSPILFKKVACKLALFLLKYNKTIFISTNMLIGVYNIAGLSIGM